MKNLIQPYNPNWAIEFNELKNCLLEILHGLDIDIQHIGSTSIPDLPAKPILDVDIIIQDKLILPDISKKLEKIGYMCKGEQGIKGRFAYRQITEQTPRKGKFKKWREHHLYVCYSDSLALRNHLLFRDALLNDRKLVEEYSKLKTNLAIEIGMTREKYTQRKTDFIISVLKKLGLNERELGVIISANM